MVGQLHNELRKEFQLERLILFSDAVFAIAITLLVIEIKIPDKESLREHGGISDANILKALGYLTPKFLGFLISFILIGLYWTIHHRMFGFVTGSDRKLLVLNLIFLFFIALMPFSTGFYSEYSGSEMFEQPLKVPMTFYVLNYCGVGFSNYFMWRHVGKEKNKLAEPPIAPLVLKLAYARSLTVPIIFLLMLPIAYFANVMFAVWVPLMIPLCILKIRKRITRKHASSGHSKKYCMKKKVFAVLATLITINAFSQTDSIPTFIKDSLDNYVNRALSDWQIPGAAVCIVKNGKVVTMKGYGVRDYDTREKVDENTLFMIGSNTKAFTATALAMLNADTLPGKGGKLSLDDKVTKWIPEFKLDNAAAGEQAIIRDLLCHRIGFRTFQGDFTYWTSNLTRSEVIEKMGHIKATYPFRTTWGYTNAAFLTAGQIIPRATGMEWEDFIKARIFDPLEMKNTLALSKDLPNASDKCSPYTKADGKLVKIPFCYIDNLAPAGSISSSVSDMSHWVLMQLDNGKYNGKQVVPAAAIAQTRTPHSILGNGGSLFNEGHFALYGLGWFLQEYCGRKIVSHTGGVNGFVTSVTLVPEEKLGIIVFTNTDQNEFYEALKWDIMDAYFGKPYRNYSKVYLGFYQQQFNAEEKKDQVLKDSVAMHLKPNLPLEAYEGNYFNTVYGNMKVVSENGELKMKFSHHPNMYAKLESLGGDRFYATFTDPEFSKAVFPFHVENGKVKSVTVKVADFVEFNPYEFSKQPDGFPK